MNKKAKVGLISLGILLVLSLVFIIVILPLISAPDEPRIYYRTATSDVYKNPDGTYTTILYNEQVNIDTKDRRFPHYVLPNETFFQIIPSDRTEYDFKLDDKYTKYQVYVRNNSNTEGAVRFEKDGYFFTYDLSGGQMLWAVSQPGKNDTDTLGGGAPSNSQDTQVVIDVNKANYSNAFYNTDVIYTMQMNMLKEVFILKNAPPSYKDYEYLQYSGNIKFNKTLDICANGVCYIPSGTQDDFETSGRIDFRNESGDIIFYLKEPIITDSNGNSIKGIYKVHGSNAQMNFYLRINKAWLQNAVYPIYIDPTVTLQTAGTENLEDAGISSYDTGYYNFTYLNYGITDSFVVGNIYLSNYNDTRNAFIKFKISSFSGSISVYSITYSSLSLAGASYYGDVPITINVFKHDNQSWVEGTLDGGNCTNPSSCGNGITWIRQPGGISTFLSSNTTVEYLGSSQFMSGWGDFNVTSWVNQSYFSGYENVSFYLNSTYTQGIQTGVVFGSKEYYISERPKLTITYTPYINIISPTPSQIFTEDAPTARFNVTTAVAMDECRWTEDSGTTNYTLTRLNASYFWLQNQSILDGNHTVKYYCNQSDDGTWRTSDTINFEVDSVNITRCRDLHIGVRIYLQKNNIEADKAVDNPCFQITNSSEAIIVTLNSQGFYTRGNGGDYFKTVTYSTHGFNISNANLSNFVDFTNTGGSINGGIIVKNTTFSNFTFIFDASAKVTVWNSTFGSNINSLTGNWQAGEIKIYNSKSESGRFDVWLNSREYTNLSVYNSNFSSSTIKFYWQDIYDGAYFVNSSSPSSISQSTANGHMYSQWYFDSNVTDTVAGGMIANANITIKDINGNVILSLLTDTNGDISRQVLTEYINNGTKRYQTPHNVSVSKTGYYTNSTLINITSLQNVFYETNIKKASVGVNVVSPANQTYNNRTVYFNVTVDKAIGSCNYSINGWANNYSLTSFNASYYSASNKSMADGSFIARFWCIDTDGNVNGTSLRYFSVDATPPLISYNPDTDSASYVNRNWIFINVTASDANKDTVRLDWSTIGNETFDNSGGNYYWENKTGLANQQYTFYAWINDSAGNKNVTVLRTITVDTIKPSIVIKQPTNITYNVNISNLNYTYSDTNPSSCWYSRDIGITNSTAVTAGINWSNTVSIEGSNNYTVFCNDSVNNINITTIYFFKDTVFPVIINGTGTEENGANFTRTNVYVNVTITELNEKNITFLLYKSGIINETGFTTAIRAINWTGLSDGVYYYNVTIIDTSGNTNTSITRRIGLDNTGPIVTIEHPKAQSYSTTNFSLNYTVSDATTYVSTCWFKVENLSVYLTISNTTIPCTNTTFNLTADGNYNLTFYANDSLNKLTTKVVAFSLSTALPSVVLDSPKENEWLKTTSITFNFTATDAHTFDNNCSLWGDWTGTWHKNYTWHIPNSGLQNYTTVILTEGGSYKYNVFCNESNGVASWGLTNVTFGIDQTFPQVKTVYPTNTTYTTTISVFNYTYTDTNPGSCWYSKDRGTVNSTSVLAGINFTGITSIEGSNNYTLFCNDTANNINSSTIYFTIESTPPVIAVVYPSNINYNINVSNLNYTYSDTNPGSCWYSRDIGTTNSTSIVAGINWSNVKSNEGTNNYTLYCNDTSNLLSSSLITFYKDTIFPQTNITYPQNKSYNIELIYLNYTYSDTNPSSCWYSRDIGITNLSIVDAGFNFSYIASVESSNNWTLYCNDTFGNLNTTTLYFYKDMGLPLISIVYPENTTYVINVSNLNYTVSDLNLESCWYSRNKSISNISITCGNNVSDIISVEENNTYTVWANDTSGNVNSYTTNFFKDTIFPEILIIDPINGSVFSEYFINLTLNVSVNYSDITGYWWNYNDGVYNYSFTPNTTIAWTQMQDTTKTYILTIWVNDTHNNTAYNTSTFTMIILKSGGISSTGGGGGGKVTTVEKLIQGAVCGNKICEEGEYFYNCPQDCGQNLDTLFLNCFSKDPVKRETCAWNKATALTWAFILTAVFVTIYIGRSLYKKYKKEKPKQIY